GQLGIVLTFGDYPEAGETPDDVVPVPPVAGWPPAWVASGSGMGRAYQDMDNLRGSDTAGDRMFGLEGNDSLDGFGGDDELDGGAGSDLIHGGLGSDRITGGAGDDLIFGDRIASNVGSALGSTDGETYVPYGQGNTPVFSGLGWGYEAGPSGAFIWGTAGAGYFGGHDDYIDAGDGDDGVYAGDGNDVVDGGDGADFLAGEAGDDILSGGAGDDLLLGDHQQATNPGLFNYSIIAEGGRDELHGGDGNDTLIGFGNDDTLYGDDGDDVLYGDGDGNVVVASAENGADFLDGGAGDDQLHGGGGHDWLIGGAGNDLLSGDGGITPGAAYGNDLLEGGEGNDQLIGDGGSDWLFGEAGNDQLFGDRDAPGLNPALHGNDYLDGGAGDDTLVGSGGNDELIGGEGADILYGDQGVAGLAGEFQGDDVLDGGAGADVLVGGGGADRLRGGDGADTLHGDDVLSRTPVAFHGNDHIAAGEGDDVVFGWGGDDTLLGEDGNDQLVGDEVTLDAAYHGNDTLDGGAGNDLLWGLGGDDHLIGGDGDDVLDGDNGAMPALIGNDTLEGGAGNDSLYGRGGDDELFGGSGNDGLSGGEGDDALYGEDGNDTLLGGVGNDILSGGRGIDVLQGGAGDDTYIFPAEDIQIVDNVADGIIDTEGRNQVIFFSGLTSTQVQVTAGAAAGSVNLASSDGTLGLVLRDALAGSIESIQFADGVFVSAAALLGSRLDAAANQNSTVSGVSLYGGVRADTIVSTGSDVTISGGKGNDLLVGGQGSTTYLFARGDGRDTLTDLSTFEASGGTQSNVLVLGEGISSSDVVLVADAGSGKATLELGQGDAVVLNDFSIEDPVGGLRTLDAIRFSDATTLSWRQLLEARGISITNITGMAAFAGTPFDDLITGSSAAETISGGAGDDVIDGGGGNDLLTGGSGSDTYILRQGSGADTINNFDNEAASTDRLVIDSSISPLDVEFFRIGQSLLVRLRNSTDQVLVTDYFDDAGLDEIVLSNGTMYTPDTIPWQEQASNVFLYSRGDGHRTFQVSDPVGVVLDSLRFSHTVAPGTVVLATGNNGDLVVRFRNENGSLDSSDRITVPAALLVPAASLDRIEFDAAPDLLWSAQDIRFRAQYATEDSDQLHGTMHDDVLAGLAGNDIIEGYAGDDELIGGVGSDVLRGGDGNDLLDGGADNDTLEGGGGSDTFLVRPGGGGDRIQSFDTDELSIDVLLFGAGIDPDTLRVAPSGQDLYLSYADLTANAMASVRIVGYLNPARQNQVIDQIRFTDAPGVVWTLVDVRERLYGPTSGSDMLRGADGDDVLLGLEGNDTLQGEAGNDDLDGGAGTDALYGGEGNDTYRFGVGYGIDQIIEVGGADTIFFNEGVVSTDVDLIKTYVDSNGNADLLIILNNLDRLTLLNYYTAAGAVESLAFSSGTVWTAADVAARLLDLTGSANTQTGTSGDDTYTVDHINDGIVETAGGGIDTACATTSYTLPAYVERLVLQGVADLFGNGNFLDNTITGNSGNNRLHGSSGVDTLIGGPGDDTYTVRAPSNISAVDDFVIENIGEGYDTYIIELGYGGSLPANVERLIYYPGNSWYESQNEVLSGNDLDNVIDASAPTAGGRVVRIDGRAGADWMIGGDARNVYVVDNEGDIVDERNLGSATDTVESSIAFVLPILVENLVLTGSAPISGTGNGGANQINGATNTAANLLIGSAGDDTYILGAGDTVFEIVGGGIDTIVINHASLSSSLADYENVENIQLGSAAVTTAAGDDGNNRIVGNASSNTLFGAGGDDTLIDGPIPGSIWEHSHFDILHGGDGNDRLISNSGYDTLIGGPGDDELIAYAYTPASTASFVFGHGSDYDTVVYARGRVKFDDSVSPGNVRMMREGATLYVYVGTTDRLVVVAFSSATSWEFSESFLGFLFTSTGTQWGVAEVQAVIQDDGMLPSSGNDVLDGTAMRDRIDGLAGSDTINGFAGDDQLEGGIGNDFLSGGSGEDSLNGGLGNDLLSGGAGSDTYAFSAGFGLDLIRDTEVGQVQDAGVDRVIFDATISRDEVVFTRSETDPTDLWVTRRGTGDRLTVELFFAGPTVGDLIEQFVFADGAVVTSGDLLGASVVHGSNAADVLTASSIGDTLYGYGGNDTLTGGTGGDVLDGGAGADIMAGGSGDDLYRVDNPADLIVEQPGDGDDAVDSVVSFVLSDHLEHLHLGGTAAIDATGNGSANRLIGNEAANQLDGRGGADTMIGRGGNDTYIVDDVQDVVREEEAEGYDTVNASVSYALPHHAEALVLHGANHIDATGNTQNNYLRGNTGNNRIDGMAGADTMVGGLGDDLYIIDNVGDVVVENDDEGMDTIESSVSYHASENIEIVRLVGTAAIDGIGNALNNTLIGNAAANMLDGAAGADEMQGGVGNDTYVIDSVSDVVIEQASEGEDLIISVIGLALPNHVERLRLVGNGLIDGTGNALNNTIEGNARANVLDGGLGADIMSGGAGDDFYLVDNIGDVVTELADAGIDTVHSIVSFSMGSSQIEHLLLLGSDAISGFGNALDNMVIGNDAANTLDGGGGNDVLDGRGGNDIMAGGAGNDIYIVDSADSITEYANGGVDMVRASVTHTLAANVEDLELLGTGDINGTGNSLVNLITGNSGNNTLNGGGGADTLIGGAGNDTYVVDNAGDTVIEEAEEGIDAVHSSVSFTLGTYFENLTLTGSSVINGTGNALDNHLIGNSGNNVLTGGEGDDVIDGGAGNDTLIGGSGNDTYVVNSTADVVTEAADAGLDLAIASATYTLSGNVENLTLSGSASINGTGNELANTIIGNSGNNVLNGGAGADTLIGGAGNDTYVVDNVGDVIVEEANQGTDLIQSALSYALGENLENLTLTGTAAINGVGNALANVLTGNSADNVLDGGAGVDQFAGGVGNDTYVVDATSELITEAAGAGIDSVFSSASFTLAANVENLTLTGSENINATGNASANTLIGNSADNVLNGAGGADTMQGGSGNDTYVVDSAGDMIIEIAGEGIDLVQSSVSFVLSAAIENLTLTGSSGLTGTGNELDNILTGNSGANTLLGGDGNDALDGGAGNDRMEGGAGDDIYVVANTGDVVVEAVGAGGDTVQASITYTLAANVEELLLTGSAAINGTGNDLDNVITGNGAANTLSGGLGADMLIGAGGNDIYVIDNPDDVVVENSAEGVDTVQSTITHALAANVENLTLTGGAAINGAGNELDNVLVGNGAANALTGGSGNDTLNGGAGADQLAGGMGDDLYVVDNVGDVIVESADEGNDTVQSSITYVLGINLENLTLTGTSALNGTGNAADNVLVGNSGANTLDGGTGADSMSGGAGSDIYLVDHVDDIVIENAGTDLVQSSVTYTLSSNVENLTLTGTADIDATGSEQNNVLTGNVGANRLTGGAGNDTYYVDNVGDIVIELADEGIDTVQSSITFMLGAHVENLTLTGSSAIHGTGNDLDNVLTGNSGVNILIGGAGDDVLNGGAGADQLIGGAGNDTYVVDNTGDVVSELVDEGIDVVQSSVSYVLGANLENLTLTGSSGISATGNSLDNVLVGNSGANTLNGGGGADTMSGGTGNDTYVVDNIDDVVIENVGAGTDLVQSSVTYVLGSNVENLTLTGAANINGTGNELANVLTGNAGANVLSGGLGNDTYVISDASDSVVELADGGIDLVQASLTYALTANVENLTLTSSAAINGTGNVLDNLLTGNSGANILIGGAGDDTLNGGAGADSLQGGMGDDLYVVDNAADAIIEVAGEGIDTVQSSIAFVLGDNLENLTLTGSSAIAGTGNTLDNILTGNSGANTLAGGAGNDTLDGGSGNDTMRGGTGNDLYIVAQAGDVVAEDAAEGIDTVRSSVSYMLGANVEHLTLTGTGVLNATGNELANVLTGNTGANTLAGMAGDDILIGGNGADIYSYSAGHGADTIDNSSTDAALDRLNFTNLTRSQVTFSRSGDDLLMLRDAVDTDSVRVTNWFTVTGNQLDFVQFTDQTLTSVQINALFEEGGQSGFASYQVG
ncbi:MAG TPA: calcium-binding protein, partial [Povalibacter sp.]|uniref:calcium-binding protein n=1 Tax=Povalibacter sp. TaxID=1962978 RepID=UPI002C580B59